MTEHSQMAALLVGVVGVIFVAVALVRRASAAIGVPALVGYILIGFAIKLADIPWGGLEDPIARQAFVFLADLGIVILLFRVGLEMEPEHLLKRLPRASVIFVFNMAISGLAGYAVAAWVLDMGLLTALIVATALTATSIGVSVAVWQEAGALKTRNGHLLVNVAELDDIAAVALFALLFSVIPVFREGGTVTWELVAAPAGAFAGKLALFGLGCLLFARYASDWCSRVGRVIEPSPRPMMTVMGMGFLVAGIGGWLGLSLAVGALFAGLIFARDRDSLENMWSFDFLHRYIAPFFFIEIGMTLEPSALLAGLEIGGWLLLAAVAGKFVGAVFPARISTDWKGGTLLGISMVPRAEIALLIAAEGRRLGPSVVGDDLYAAIVVVSAATCILGPAVLRPLLVRWPQPAG